MSLLIWLPLTSNTNNQGLSNVTVTNTNVTIDHTDANLGGCGYFNGSARIQISLPTELTSLKNTTVCGWLKGNGPMGGISHDGGTDKACCTFVGTSWQYPNGSNWGNITGYATSTEWRHVAITTADNTITCYLNGNVVTTTTVSGGSKLTDLTSANFIELGSDFPGGNEYLTGRICDFRVYDHCLSKKEIKEISKGLMTHLPLSWGANSNMIKNSYTWMNKNLGTTNGASSSLTVTKSIIEDDTAPCHWALKVICTNTGSATGSWVGPYFPIGVQGLATSDLVSGETYTYSFWAKLDSSSTGTTAFVPSSIVESQTLVSSSGFENLDSNWRKHTVTFNWTSTGKLTACFYSSIPANSTVTYYICGIKLEKGTKVTSYIPHTAETAYTNYGYASKYYQDCSGYSRNVTVSGTLTIGENSPRGTGTNFNKAKITISDGFPIGTQPPFTIAYWHKPITGTYTTWADSVGFNVGNAESTAASTQMRRETYNNTGTGYAWYGNGVVNNGGGDCTYTPTMDTWYHYVYTFNGTTFTQYINGVQNKTATLGSTYTGFKTYGTFYIGDTANFYQEATDLRVYGTCLSAEDVRELYEVSVQIDKSGKIYCNELVEV